MNRTLLLTTSSLMFSGVVAAALVACATSDAASGSRDDEASSVVTPAPSSDAAVTFGDAATGCDAADPACAQPPTCSTADFCEVDAELDPTHPLLSVHGTTSTDVWAVGSVGTLLHYDGNAWTSVPTERGETFRGVWVTGPDDVWISSMLQLVFHVTRDEDGTLALASRPGVEAPNPAFISTVPASAVIGSPDGREILLGLGPQIPSPDRPAWSTPLFHGMSLLVRSPEATSSWTRVPDKRGVYDVGWADGPWVDALWGDDAAAWQVGSSGLAARAAGFWGSEGKAPWVTFDTQTTRELTSVIGFPDGSVWAVGHHGVVRRYDGGATPRFDIVDVPSTEDLYGIWGTSSSNVWIVGANATILHYDGKSWRRASVFLKAPGTPNLHGIWGAGERDVWAVGKGVIVRLTDDGADRGGVQ